MNVKKSSYFYLLQHIHRLFLHPFNFPYKNITNGYLQILPKSYLHPFQPNYPNVITLQQYTIHSFVFAVSGVRISSKFSENPVLSDEHESLSSVVSVKSGDRIASARPRDCIFSRPPVLSSMISRLNSFSRTGLKDFHDMK